MAKVARWWLRLCLRAILLVDNPQYSGIHRTVVLMHGMACYTAYVSDRLCLDVWTIFDGHRLLILHLLCLIVLILPQIGNARVPQIIRAPPAMTPITPANARVDALLSDSRRLDARQDTKLLIDLFGRRVRPKLTLRQLFVIFSWCFV